MSDIELNKTTSTENDATNANSIFHEQENSNTATDMDLVKQKETIKSGPLRIAENSVPCFDIENFPKPNENIDEENGILLNVSGLKLHVITPDVKRRKFAVLGLYDHVFGSHQRQPQGHARYTSQLWRQQQPVPQPQQTIWTQYGPPPNRQYPNQGTPYPQGDGGYQGAYGYDGGGPFLYDPGSRNSFVRLVMGLVLLMLLATAAFLAVVLFIPEVKEFFQRCGWVILLPSMVCLIVVNCAMMFSPCARRPPCNFVCLFLATVSMSVFSARVTCHYRTEIIFYAVIATSAVVFVCVVLAFSRFDFTSYILYFIAIATAFSVIAMIIILTMVLTGSMMKPVILVVLSVGTLIQIVMEIKNFGKCSVCEIIRNYHEHTDSD